jgi:hypothetical protein
LNAFGGVNDLLTTARPGQFVGVQLVGGVHADSSFLESLGSLNFVYCAEPIGGMEPVQTEFLTENSTPNTALSLDGRRQTRQSVGQHVCTG